MAQPVWAESSATHSMLQNWACRSPGAAAQALPTLELPRHSAERVETRLPALRSYPRSLAAH
eukprot:891792-Pyramimonas_sp.AAC.1